MTVADALQTHLLEQAHANQWINAAWWKALDALTVADMDQPQGAFFDSIWGTWNHLLLTDCLWLGRFVGRPFAIQKLSDRLCDTKPDFQRERSRTDREWIDAIAALPDVQALLVYRNTAGAEFRTPIYQALQHVFMHQAHHRAQIHQMCNERNIALPDGGLIAFYRVRPPLPTSKEDSVTGLRAVLLEQAHANRWINRQWWKVLQPMTLEELDRPQGAFFGSIFATWNHILLGDRIWLGRITGRPYHFSKLSDRPCATVEEYLVERDKTDQALVDQVAAEPDITRTLKYRGNQNQPYGTPLPQVFQHLFAHQAHHRGQIHQMCSERKIALPDGGLIGYYRGR
jgi:uncharacterized damage-inducible protein DinB